MSFLANINTDMRLLITAAVVVVILDWRTARRSDAAKGLPAAKTMLKESVATIAATALVGMLLLA